MYSTVTKMEKSSSSSKVGTYIMHGYAQEAHRHWLRMIPAFSLSSFTSHCKSRRKLLNPTIFDISLKTSPI
jgi:hypothetical protein